MPAAAVGGSTAPGRYSPDRITADRITRQLATRGEISFELKVSGNTFGGMASATFFDASGRQIRGPRQVTMEGERVLHDQPASKLLHTFPGNWCGVPTIVGHFFVQSVPVIHGLIVMDIAEPAQPVEVSRLTLSDEFTPHWTGWDAKTHRLVVTGSAGRLYMVKLNESTGSLALDTAFHDANGKPGFDFANRKWPHGWRGTGKPHGVVFSR